MSLYANLLNPKADSSTSISGAPVLYGNNDKEDPASKKEANPGTSGQKARLHRPFFSRAILVPVQSGQLFMIIAAD